MQKLFLFARLTGQSEEGQTVPACAGDRGCDGAERRVVAVLIPEPLRENLHQYGSSFPLPTEQNAGQRQPAILVRAIPVPGRCLERPACDGEEVSGCHYSQVNVPGDLLRSAPSACREISLRPRL